MIGIMMFMTVARSIRRIIEGQQKRQEKAEAEQRGASLALRTPSDVFHDEVWLPLCEHVAALAAERMKRGLKEEERRAVWRARSQLVLEILLKELGAAEPGEAAALLKNAPCGLDRPDPTGWCERR